MKHSVLTYLITKDEYRYHGEMVPKRLSSSTRCDILEFCKKNIPWVYLTSVDVKFQDNTIQTYIILNNRLIIHSCHGPAIKSRWGDFFYWYGDEITPKDFFKRLEFVYPPPIDDEYKFLLKLKYTQ